MKENDTEKLILDACCGSRMFWFDKKSPITVFMDNRKMSDILSDGRTLEINPDIIGDFRNIPFGDNQFNLVVFDPPHLVKVGEKSWLAKKYGRLNQTTFKTDLSQGFKECFRVLNTNGILIFKWNETDIKVNEILELSPYTPLFGNKCGKLNKTHWIVFMKNKEFYKKEN